MSLEALKTSLADRNRLERELGQGGMAAELVTEVTARLMSLKRRPAPSGPGEEAARRKDKGSL